MCDLSRTLQRLGLAPQPLLPHGFSPASGLAGAGIALFKGDIDDAGINGAVLVGGVAAFVVDMKFQESLQEKVKSEIEDPFAGMKDGAAHSIEEIRADQSSASIEFQAAVLDGRFDDTMSRERDGKKFVFTRGGICAHVMTHSMHHRAQCLNMLRHLGVDDLPQSSVFQWMNEFPPAT